VLGHRGGVNTTHHLGNPIGGVTFSGQKLSSDALAYLLMPLIALNVPDIMEPGGEAHDLEVRLVQTFRDPDYFGATFYIQRVMKVMKDTVVGKLVNEPLGNVLAGTA
jgi:hypothetical protein